MTDNDKVIQVLARLTNVGERWPLGAWIHTISKISNESIWYKTNVNDLPKLIDELSELEANQCGIYRKDSK